MGAGITRLQATVQATVGEIWAAGLYDLENTFSARYQRTWILEDLETAINYATRAVAETPEDHLDRPRRLNNPSALFNSCYERTWNLADLANAINHVEGAVKAAPEGHPNRAISLDQLSCQMNSRYDRAGNLQD